MTNQPGAAPGSVRDSALLSADAVNRALRTLVQGLGIDVVAAVLVVLVTSFNNSGGWGDLQWGLISYSVVKTIVQSLLSYVMRRYVTKEGALTPPAPQPEPAKPIDTPVDSAPADTEAQSRAPGELVDQDASTTDVPATAPVVLDENTPPEAEAQRPQVLGGAEQNVEVYPDQSPTALDTPDVSGDPR